MLIPISILCVALASPAQLSPREPPPEPSSTTTTTPTTTTTTTTPDTPAQPAGPTSATQAGDCADAAKDKDTEAKDNDAKDKEAKDKDADAAAKGPNIAAITGLVGSAATVTAALGGVIVAIAQVPAPWDYWKYADDLRRAEDAFREDPDVRHINDAGRARAGLAGIEKGFSDQLGVIVTSGISLATGATGLVASIITVAGE